MGNLTIYNIAICMTVGWGGYSYGFGFAVFVSSLGQPSFYEYFKLDPSQDYISPILPSNNPVSILGAINALFNLGLAIGALAQGWLADRLGRKKSFYLAATCSLVGAALITAAVVIEMLIVMRLLHGFGLGMLICLVPLYLTEVSPARHRGFLSGFTTLSFGLGYVVCSWLSVGTFFAKNLAIQWRMPLAMACVGPLALLIGLPFIPESPRFLVMKGHNDEAWTIIKRLHHSASDPDDAFAHAELTQIVRQVEFDRENNVGYIEMFKKPSWRRRSLLAMFIQFAAQSTGILGIANFITLILGSLGMTGVMPLLVYALFTTVGTIFVFVAISIVDKMGRRTMFLIGFPAMAVCLLIEGVLQSRYLGSDNQAGLAACVAFMFIYLVCFQFVDAPAFIYVSEIFPTAIRAKGNSLGFFAYFVGAITYTTPAALAFKNISWRMYLIYMSLCLISVVIVYFYVPETKQLPVEEIGALFGDEVVVHLTADGHGIVEDGKEVKVEEREDIGQTEKA